MPVGRPTTCGEQGKDFSFTCGPSLSEDDDELTESKIRAFLDEKVYFYPLCSQILLTLASQIVLTMKCN